MAPPFQSNSGTKREISAHLQEADAAGGPHFDIPAFVGRSHCHGALSCLSNHTSRRSNLHKSACLVRPQETMRPKDTELVLDVDGPFLTVFLDHAASVAAVADTVGAPIRGEK